MPGHSTDFGGLNKEQREASTTLNGHVITLAGAGTGKTRTLLARFNCLLESGIPLKKILCTSFTVESAKTMAKRAGLPKEQTTFCTFHSLGYRIILAERALLHFPLSEDPVQPKARARLIFRLIRKYDLEDFKALESYISRMKRFGVDPRQALEMGGELDSYSYARAYEEYDRLMRLEGWLDFDSMLTESLHLLKTNPAVRDRWQFQACHPPGTLVAVSGKYKAKSRNLFIVEQRPIEKLKSGDTVLSWDRRRRRVPILRPRKVSVGKRFYAGRMLTIFADGKKTRVTPDHQLWVRMVNTEGKHAVYLMWRKGVGFRIGISGLKGASGQNRMRNRCSHEGASSGWILKICSGKTEALFWEELYSVRYGIPEREFPNACRSLSEKEKSRRLFREHNSEEGGYKCLEDHGLLFSYPYYVLQKSRRAGFFKTAAANVIPGYMQIPLPDEQSSALIEKVIGDASYRGYVYSLDVQKDHTYIADELVVGNCMVDEAQDTDDVQFKIVQLLSEKYKNVFLVGDVNQSIYQWRGASPKNMLEASKWFDAPKYIYLTQNYRSTQAIVAYCKKHAPIQTEQVKLMTSARGVVGDPIEYGFYSNADAEAEGAILRALKNPGGTAILGRTNRLLAAVEDLCQDSKTKYNLLGKSGFWRQEEVQNVMAYACFAVDGSDASLKKIINAPFRPTQGIAKRDLLRVLKDNQETTSIHTTLFSILKRITPTLEQREKVGKLVRLLEHIRDSRIANAADYMQHIVECIDAESHYDDEETEDNYALENIRALVKRAAKFKSLEEFVEHARKCANAPKARKDVLTISTIHQAKGQEWTNVIVIGVADGMLPHKKGDPDEEARIFYVAISRPADVLRLTYAGLPSKYIKDELPKQQVPESEQRRLIAEKATQVPLFDFGGKV